MRPAYCYQAEIVGVDKDTHMVTVKQAQDGESPAHGIRLGASYAHPLSGSGSFSLPAVGATCFVLQPSDSSPGVIVSYTMPTGPQEGQKGGRIDVEPGDQALTGDERNFVIARANGIVEIGSSALCRSMYFPISNILDVYFDELNWKTGLGGLKWTGKDGEAVYEFRAALAPEQAATVYVRAGKTRGVQVQQANMIGSAGVALEFVVDPAGAGKVFGFHVGEDGNFSTESKGNGALSVVGSWMGEISDYVNLVVGKTINLTVRGDMLVDAPNETHVLKNALSVSAGGGIDLTSPRVTAGKGVLTPATRSTELILLLQQLLTEIGRPDVIAMLPWATIASKVVKVA